MHWPAPRLSPLLRPELPSCMDTMAFQVAREMPP